MNTPDQKNDMYTSFIKDVKEYIEMNYDLFRLNLLEKLSIILSIFFASLLCILFITLAAIHFSMAFIHWTALFFHSLIPGLLIMGGIWIILFFMFYLLRKRIFVNPMIKILSRILFHHHKKTTKNEEE